MSKSLTETTNNHPMIDGFNKCHVAWLLIYGDESHGRGDRQLDANLVRDRTFQPGPTSDFELKRFRGKEFAYFYKPTGQAAGVNVFHSALIVELLRELIEKR